MNTKPKVLTDQIVVRVSPEERRQWEESAAEYGHSLSRYVRAMVNLGSAYPSGEPEP